MRGTIEEALRRWPDLLAMVRAGEAIGTADVLDAPLDERREYLE